MLPSDAGPVKNATARDDPVWLIKIIEFLRTHAQQFDQHEHMQFVFNRAGDQVQADYSVRSIKIR